MKYLFFGVAILLFFAIYFHNVIEFDQDLGRHLLTGKIIWQSHSVPKINLYSYTQTNFPFINSHWLSEVVFYLVGVSNLVYFKTLVLITAMTLTLYTTYKYSKNLVATALAFAIFVPVLLERTEIRPEIFSYLFISIFMYILTSYYVLRIKYYGHLLWLLPLIEILWVNMHIYFILGPILVLIFSFSSLRNTKYIILNTALVFLATLINPNFISGAIYPLTVFNNYGYSIVENQNIFFLQSLIFNPNILYFEIAAGLFIISCFFNKFNLLTLLLILPVLHIRSLPLLFLILLPVFAKNLTRFSSKYIVPAVLILTLFRPYNLISNQYYQAIDSQKRFGTEIKESYKGAVDFFLANKLRGPIFNNFDIGSYLDYRLYPSEKVFVDGRPEAYPAEFFQNLYIPMQMLAENFAIVDKIYNFNVIIFSLTDGTPWGQKFLQDIVQNKDFTLVYVDDKAAILTHQKNISAVKIPANNTGPFVLNPGLILF